MQVGRGDNLTLAPRSSASVNPIQGTHSPVPTKHNPTKFLKSLASEWAALWKEGTMCDTTLLCGPDEEPIRAHKLVLCCRSTYFNRMFQCGMKEKESEEVRFPDIDKQHMEEVLRFLYTSEIVLTIDNLVPMFILADRLLLDDLKRVCLCFTLSSENVLQVLQDCAGIAKLLYKRALTFLESCDETTLVTIFNHPSWLTLPSDIVTDIFKKCHLNLPEVTLFHRLLLWAIHQHHHKDHPNDDVPPPTIEAIKNDKELRSSIKTIMKPVVPYVRLSQMSKMQLINEVEPLGVVSTPYVLHAWKWIADPTLFSVVNSHHMLPRQTKCIFQVNFNGTAGCSNLVEKFGLHWMLTMKEDPQPEDPDISMLAVNLTCYSRPSVQMQWKCKILSKDELVHPYVCRNGQKVPKELLLDAVNQYHVDGMVTIALWFQSLPFEYSATISSGVRAPRA
jgi:hypothetical protein